MLKKIFSWIKNLFSSEENKAEMLEIISDNLNAPQLKELYDADLMNKAFEFVKELHVNTALTAKEKQRIFNHMLSEYAGKVGKVISNMAINLLRELAYTALKIALTKGLTMLLADGRRVTADTVTCRAEPEQLELDFELDFELKA